MGKKPKGRVYFLKSRRRWYVSWYHSGKEYKVYLNLDGSKLATKAEAESLLNVMRLEDQTSTFNINKYTKSFTDTASYLQRWHRNHKHLWKPSTAKTYAGHIRNYLLPFFESNPCNLNDIKRDTLYELLVFCGDKAGSTKAAIFNCLHSCLDDAWQSERIQAIPRFPKRKDFRIIEPEFKWLSEADQIKVLNCIPVEHQPIFWFLKFHMRRPAEARALHKQDYDRDKGLFTICRTISGRELVNQTKTGEVHVIPCHSEFKTMLENVKPNGILSPFMFTCKSSHQLSKRYTDAIMNRIWRNAMEEAGLPYLSKYPGTKHSSCTQYLNEKNISLTDLMAITGHKQLQTVARYAKTETSRVRELMETPNLTSIKKERKKVESV